jgi:hypothetical protein
MYEAIERAAPRSRRLVTRRLTADVNPLTDVILLP